MTEHLISCVLEVRDLRFYVAVTIIISKYKSRCWQKTRFVVETTSNDYTTVLKYCTNTEHGGPNIDDFNRRCGAIYGDIVQGSSNVGRRNRPATIPLLPLPSVGQ